MYLEKKANILSLLRRTWVCSVIGKGECVALAQGIETYYWFGFPTRIVVLLVHYEGGGLYSHCMMGERQNVSL